MKYTGSLQSIHIKLNKLEDLDRLLREESTEPNVKYELETDEFTYEYSTPSEIWKSSLVQDFVHDFRIDLSCEEGDVKIETYEAYSDEETEIYSNSRDIKLWIKGEDDWTRSKKEKIDSFFDVHGNRIRTILTKKHSQIMIGGTILTGLFFNYALRGRIDPVLAGFVFFFLIAILMRPLQYFHPYSLLVLDADEKLRPNSHKVAATIGVLGGIVGLLNFVGLGTL